MADLFGLDIAGIINDALGESLLDATLIKNKVGTRTSGSLSGGTNTTTSKHSAQGVITDYKDNQIDGTLVKSGDRKILLLGASISGTKIPELQDKITIDGATYTIVGPVKRDPASASYICQGRL